MVALVIFWVAVFLMFHSYVLFPLLLHLWSRNKTNNNITFANTESLPTVSVIISVYNEEYVIEHRILNVLQSFYPSEKIEILVGSDGSTDRTNTILQQIVNQYSSVRSFVYLQRKGKGNVLNNLVKEANGDILIFTDAKVEFTHQTIFELVKHFKNNAIGIVGGNIVNRNVNKDGISIQERKFMSREMVIKYNEGRIWGTMIGAYGACFAIRSHDFIIIPKDFAVEDFYITLKIIGKGLKGILELDAICYEDVPNQLNQEFRRKVRISSGNFQNIRALYNILFKFNVLSFCFFSHKVIRWFGPFLLLMAFASNVVLALHNTLYSITLVLQLLLIIIPPIDFFLQKIHLHSITLRFITHFYTMNLALLIGFIKYLKGVKTNVWEPTTRTHQ